MGILYIIATPIGNLKDITLRALEVLKEVDLIVCEDTRVTSKLLARYNISKPLTSYFQHSKLSKIDYILSELRAGKNIALVTDAGTPGIADPGGILTQRNEFAPRIHKLSTINNRGKRKKDFAKISYLEKTSLIRCGGKL